MRTSKPKARWASRFATVLVVAVAGCSSSDVNRTPDGGADLSGADVSISDAGVDLVDEGDAIPPRDLGSDSEPSDKLSKSLPREMVACGAPRASQRVQRFERDLPFELPDLSDENVEGENYNFPLGSPFADPGAIGLKFNVSPPLQSVSGRGAFAEPGEDVKVQVGLKAGNLDYESVLVAVLVDYQPVDAEFVRLAPDRSEVLDTETTSQKRYPIDDEYRGVLLDITIPADVFEEERMYDIAVMGSYNRPHDVFGTRVRDIRGVTTLFYGGFDIPEHPCFDPGAYVEVVDMESFELQARPITSHTARFVAEGVETLEQLEAPIELSADTSTLSGQLYVYSGGVGARTRAVVLMPYINDEPWPEGAQWHFIPALQGLFVDKIDVEVPIPAASGQHRVVYKEWSVPFSPRITPEGEREHPLPPVASDGVQPFLVQRP